MAISTSIMILGSADSEASRLRRSLARHFMMAEYARNLDEARQLALRCQFHVLIVVDPAAPWDELKRNLADSDWAPAQILLVGDPAFAETAVDALRGGASDVLLRPFSTDELVAAVKSLGEQPDAPRKAASTQRMLVGETDAMQDVRALIERIAPTPATVLIEGETGTGKDLVARLLHEQSGRKGPFIPV